MLEGPQNQLPPAECEQPDDDAPEYGWLIVSGMFVLWLIACGVGLWRGSL